MNKKRYKYFFFIFLLCTASHTVRSADHSILPLHVDRFIQDCQQRIHFKVKSAEHFLSALRWYNQYVFDQNLAFLPICFDVPTTVNSAEDDAGLNSLPKQFDAQVVFVDHTKAFVRGSKLHINATHPYHVFIHELAHLVYFADEYVLSDRLLAQQCDLEGYANKRPSNYSSDEDYIWVLLEQIGGIIIDEQCSEFTGKRWVKIKNDKWHFLQYSDLSYIPRIYQHIWQFRLQDRP